MLLTERPRRAMAMKRRRCFMFTDVLTLDYTARIFNPGWNYAKTGGGTGEGSVNKGITDVLILPSIVFFPLWCDRNLYFSFVFRRGNNKRKQWKDFSWPWWCSSSRCRTKMDG